MPETEQSVLRPEKHRRLIADLASVCEVANVPPHMVKQSAKPFLSAKQLDWLVRFPQYAEAGRGLVVLGEQAIAPDTIMMAMAGALIRNYIDARVVSLNTLLKALEHDVELNLLASAKEDEEASLQGLEFAKGDRVKIKEGSFQNFEGHVDSIDETKGIVTVLLSIFGRATPVDVEYWQLEKM